MELVSAGVPTCVSSVLRCVRAVQCFANINRLFFFHWAVSKNVFHYTSSQNRRPWKSALGLYCFLQCLTTFSRIARLWSYGEGRANIFVNHEYVGFRKDSRPILKYCRLIIMRIDRFSKSMKVLVTLAGNPFEIRIRNPQTTNREPCCSFSPLGQRFQDFGKCILLPYKS